MLGTDYIETGEVANFQNLAIDTCTTRILNAKQIFSEQRPKVIGLPTALPPLELTDVPTYGDIKTEFANFIDKPVQFTNIVNLLQTSLNSRGLYFKEFFDENNMIRYNLGYNCLEYLATNHAFDSIPYVTGGSLLAVQGRSLTTIFQMRDELTTAINNAYIEVDSSNHSFTGISNFSNLPRSNNVSNPTGNLATELYHVVTKRHLDKELVDFVKRSMQFTNTIYFNEIIIAAMPVIGSINGLFSTLQNELVTKAHVDREIVNLKLANNAFGGTNTFQTLIFNSLPKSSSTGSFLLASNPNEFTTKAHVDKEIALSFTNYRLADNTFAGQVMFYALPTVASLVLFATLQNELTSKGYVDREVRNIKTSDNLFTGNNNFSKIPTVPVQTSAIATQLISRNFLESGNHDMHGKLIFDQAPITATTQSIAGVNDFITKGYMDDRLLNQLPTIKFGIVNKAAANGIITVLFNSSFNYVVSIRPIIITITVILGTGSLYAVTALIIYTDHTMFKYRLLQNGAGIENEYSINYIAIQQ